MSPTLPAGACAICCWEWSPRDFDAATDAPPQRVREPFSRTQAAGRRLWCHSYYHRAEQDRGGLTFLAAEGGYDDGHAIRPKVQLHHRRRRCWPPRLLLRSTARFYDPVAQQVIDYVGGQEDHQRRPDPGDRQSQRERFEEDSLRLLRAVRFSTRLNFPDRTRDCQRPSSPAPRSSSESCPERVAEELRIMLTPPTRIAAWRLLWELELVHVTVSFPPHPASVMIADLNRVFIRSGIARFDPFRPQRWPRRYCCYRMQVERKPEDVRTAAPEKKHECRGSGDAAGAANQQRRIGSDERHVGWVWSHCCVTSDRSWR